MIGLRSRKPLCRRHVFRSSTSLNSAYSPQCDLSSEIPASLITLVDLFNRGVLFSVLFSGVVIAIALIAWSSYSEAAAEEEGDRGGDSQESYAASGLTYLVNDGVEKGFAIGVGQSGASVPVAAAKDHGCGGCTGKR
ncbi:uncharacterized protein LOC130787506 isoform X2 [Actinidia eriantha]|uniref:uncharacterized protein LOC130787506 isoform X2 n=1 Tax=Actinidia eriantha TaxID=165200 RepID=UPI0025848E0F|nr:uncharacterized protein LOC130787506 isoform X2 [Actinidia eriantha]